MAKKQPTRRVGRRPKPPGEKFTNKSRQLGRWTDEDWETLRRGAAAAGSPQIAPWARRILLAAARRAIRKQGAEP